MSAQVFAKEGFTQLGLRDETQIHRWPINFIVNDGGMGDFVNYLGGLLWTAKNCPWVNGRVFVPRYLVELYKMTLKAAPHWTVWPSEEADRRLEVGTSLIGPSIMHGKIMVSRQLLTCVGAHPFDVGFAYYAGLTPPPEGEVMPELNFVRDSLPHGLGAIKRFAVLPVGSQVNSRRTIGKHLNPIISHLNSKGILPVFLGKADVLGNGDGKISFAEDVNYHEGLDLRDQTSVVDACAIMQFAEVTVGLDCGLLHLAALAKDSKIIFGHTVANVEHRKPRRKNEALTINLSVSPEELACIGCQSNMRHIARHSFADCFYGDNKCVDLLFRNDSELWKKAIDRMIDQSKIAQ